MNLSTAMTSLARRVGGYGSPSWSDLGEFFRYHGVYAPGVRLLRSLSIPQKVLVVALCFLVPMALLAHGTFSEILQRRQQTGLELDGARYARAAVKLMTAVQAERRRELLASIGADQPAPAGEREATDAALAALAAVQSELGPRLATGAQFHEVKKLHARLRADRPADVAARMGRYSQLAGALRTLQGEALVSSGLHADPERSTHFLAELSIKGLPEAIEHLSALRANGTLRLTGSDDDEVRVRAIKRYALLGETLPQLLARQAILVQENSAAAASLRLESSLKPLSAFLEESAAQVVGPKAQGEPGAYHAMGQQALDAVLGLQQRSLDQLDADLAARMASLNGRIAILLALASTCVALAIYLLLAFYRVMDGGLSLLQEQVSRMADGDLSARPRPWGRDEVATALASLGDSLARLADLFAAVKQGVAAISHASTAIAEGTTDLTSRTDQAAAGVAQILRGVEAYTEQLEQSGRRVDEAVEAVHGLRLDALRSRNHMQRLEERMNSLRGKSAQIGEIVELIDHIAFRTNILALNASVEAAKAGEAGRSFAVVAQEVRSLAARSAESARRVHDIVLGSTEDIEQSGSLAELTARSLDETDRHVARIHESMNEIVNLSRAGQQNSQEILGEIRGVDEVAARNRALVEQMARAADDLSGQGDRLNEKVRGFKLS